MQRKMLRLIIQTKRKYKKKTEKWRESGRGSDKTGNWERWRRRKRKSRKLWRWNCWWTRLRYRLRSRQRHPWWRNWHSWHEEEEEEWIEYMKRSTDEVMERMKTAKIQCWIKTHRLAMRMASLPEERWVMKAAWWNPEFSTKYKTYRARNRWEDEINDFLRPERTEDETSNVERYNNEWFKIAKDQEGWKKRETSSQWRQQQLPAQGTSAEGERLNVHDTWRGYDSVGTDARQCSKYSECFWREVRRELDGAHLHAGLRAPELCERLPTDESDLEILDRVRSCSRKTKVPVKDGLMSTRACHTFPSLCTRSLESKDSTAVTEPFRPNSVEFVSAIACVLFVLFFVRFMWLHTLSSTVSQLRTMPRVQGTTA